MPPADATRPDENASKAALTALESILDLAAAKHPQPGRTDSIRRLNRTEYHHAIRDLLAMDVDVNAILPADESGHGFDNVTVGDLPPMLLSRYITAAQQISRLAVGSSIRSPEGINVRLPADRTQDSHVEGIGLSNLRRRIGLEVVLFSMEQHTGRGVAFVGGELTASQA